MARGRLRSSPGQSGLAVFFVIVGCASFALGIASAPKALGRSAFASTVKTDMRALADGTDLGRMTWVGLNDPSLEQTAQLSARIARTNQAFAKSGFAASFGRKGTVRFARNEAKDY